MGGGERFSATNHTTQSVVWRRAYSYFPISTLQLLISKQYFIFNHVETNYIRKPYIPILVSVVYIREITLDIKERIKQSARGQFYVYGFKNVKTEDIAKDIKISKKTIYEHFKSKEELFETVYNEDLEFELKRIREIVNNIKNSTDFDFLKELEYLFNVSSKSKCNYSKDFFRDLKIYFPLLWDKLIFLREEEFKKSFSIIWDIGIEKGFIRKEIKKQIAYLMYLESINNILQPEKMQLISASSGEIMKSIFDILLGGVLTPEAVKNYENQKENNL